MGVREIGFVSYFWVVGQAKIGFVSCISHVGQVAIGFVSHNWGIPARRDRARTGNWVCFAFFGCWVLAVGRWPGGNPDFEIPGSKRDATVG